MAKSEDIRLGQLLVRKRWCTLRQVNRGIEIQKRWKSEGKVRPLGWILVREEGLDREHLKMALAEIGQLRLSCPTCRREKPISKYNPDAAYECTKCHVELILDDQAPAAGTPSGSESRGFETIGGVPAEDTPLPSWVSTDLVDDDAIVGKIVGGCQVLDRIARGGMGVVYRAKQLKLGRIVAVKVLSEELARDRKYVHRFLQEAQSAGELSHGNIVHIIDVGELGGLFYIIMEYVDGSNLREILDVQTTLEPARAVEVALQASQALNHAHKRGIIHRDIKPENIMITREGVVKLADLGLAKKIQPDDQDGGITQTKAIMGTPYYMAPEQIKDFRQVDGRSDIYSLGVTLFRALTGAVPFEGRTPVEVMIKVVEGKRAPMRALRPGIPPELERIVDLMMARSPKDRYQSLVDVIKDLDDVLQLLKTRETRTESIPTT